MNEEELYSILSAFRETLDVINHKLEELENKAEKVDALENRLETEIIQPSIEKMEHDEDEKAFGEFKEKYGEKLDKYSPMLKGIEGDDFDATREAYEGWKSYEAPEGFEKPESADGYIEAFVDLVEEKVDQIKKDLGFPEDAKVEVTTDGENTEVTIDGEPVAEEVTEEIVEDSKDETTEDSDDVGSDESEDGELSEEDEKEIEDLMKDYKGYSVN